MYVFIGVDALDGVREVWCQVVNTKHNNHLCLCLFYCNSDTQL